MKLSKDTVEILVDMIENKLMMIQVSDREDLHEAVVLKRCLGELKDITDTNSESTRNTPTRGRRRKFTEMLEEANLPEDVRCLA